MTTSIVRVVDKSDVGGYRIGETVVYKTTTDESVMVATLADGRTYRVNIDTETATPIAGAATLSRKGAISLSYQIMLQVQS